MLRRYKRFIQRNFGGIGNFCALIALVILTAIFLNITILSKRHTPIYTKSTYAQVETHGSNSSITLDELDKTEVQKLERSSIVDAGCEIEERCSDDTIPYKIVSGEGLNTYPTICFNDKLLVGKTLQNSKIGRGINVAVLDGRNFRLKFTDNYDTYVEESFLIRALRWTLQDGDIIMMASYDEMSYSLKDSSWSLMEKFGSQLFRALKFRDSYVMIGQKGLARGKAIEMHQPKGNRDFALAAHVSGCIKFPMGPITSLPIQSADIKQEGKITFGNLVKDCGLPESCKDDEFSVHVFTGKDNNDEPKICVDGKYVIAKGINDGGRGINAVVVANGKDVIRTGHFDTWQDDSTNLEMFLENLEENAIVIAVTFDEASLKLSQHTRNLFFDLGSATIQNLKYRDVWVFVGQKGIKGFSPFEEISYAGPGNTYGTPINRRMCIPQILDGKMIRPDPIPFRNDARRDFCSRHDGYDNFCNDLNVDKSLEPVALINKTLQENSIYSTPILIIAGSSHSSLQMSMETVLMQPGLNANNVLLVVEEKYSEPVALAELFKFRAKKIDSGRNYMMHYENALKTAWKQFPDKNELIVIEENLILSPDFLYILALLSETFLKDETLNVIQLWNPNSYDHLNGSNELIYRVDQFFGLGYLIKRSFYENEMKKNFKECCSRRVWQKWKFKSNFSSLMPDVSRIFRRPFESDPSGSRYVEELFNRKRRTSLDPFPAINNVEHLRKDKYDDSLRNSIQNAKELRKITQCSQFDANFIQSIHDSESNFSSFKYIYLQEYSSDLTRLKMILPCFGLFPEQPLGLYQGVLRFSLNQSEFYLIGSKSSFNVNI